VAGLPDRPELTADAEHLVRGTRQLGDILAEMLDAAQLRTATTGFDPVDAADLAAEVVDAEQPRAKLSGITLTLRRDDGPHLVNGARTALTRVLNSMIDNALGHTGSGGNVVVEVCARGDRVVWVVTDDGVGFDPARAEEIFDRFARGTHGAGRRYGLGLALVREVVDAHGGTVTAQSPPGGGATFTVNLPASRPRRPPPPAA
jgi:signal transduction histidine kinase